MFDSIELTRLAFVDAETSLLNWQGLLESESGDEHARRGFLLVRVRWNTAASRLSPAAHGEHMKAIAAVLWSVLPEDAELVRYSKGTFAVYVRIGPTGGYPLRRLAAEIHAALEAPIVCGDHSLAVSARVALAADVSSSRDVPELARRAEIAMRTATVARTETACFTYKVEAAFDRRVALEQALRQAIDEDLLEVAFQPIISLRSGEIVAAEALARWNCPGLGIIAPSEFIGIAQDTGLIVPLGVRMLRAACAANGRWQQEGLPKIRVAVNVSLQEIGRRDFVAGVEATLRAAQLGPSSLVIEVTEAILVNPTAAELHTIDILRGIGVRVALDDFGTGHSAVTQLRTVDVDSIKLDRSFIADIDTDPFLERTTAAIVELAQLRRLRVVAEGIETAAEALVLRALGCEEAQGFFIAPPMPGEAFRALLAARRRYDVAPATRPQIGAQVSRTPTSSR
ncbi:MAG: GGDEF domain-containing phosphodiesterase [Vulcanimicrobiaceae bacterium]